MPEGGPRPRWWSEGPFRGHTTESVGVRREHDEAVVGTVPCVLIDRRRAVLPDRPHAPVIRQGAGVGRAVNEAVVIAFLGVFAFNYVFTQTLLATHPELNVIK